MELADPCPFTYNKKPTCVFFFSFPFSVGRLVFARPLVLYPPTDMKSYLGTLEASS